MNYFSGRKGAQFLSMFLKPTDKANLPRGKETPRSASARKRDQFARSKRVGYSDMGGMGHDTTTLLGSL